MIMLCLVATRCFPYLELLPVLKVSFLNNKNRYYIVYQPTLLVLRFLAHCSITHPSTCRNKVHAGIDVRVTSWLSWSRSPCCQAHCSDWRPQLSYLDLQRHNVNAVQTPEILYSSKSLAIGGFKAGLLTF